MRTLLMAVTGFTLATLIAAPAQEQSSPISPNGNEMLHLNDPNHWYPIDCCSMKDCFPLDDDDVVEENGGFTIKSTGEHVPYAKVRPSGDDKYHRCAYPNYTKMDGTGGWGGTRKLNKAVTDKACFFAPPGGI